MQQSVNLRHNKNKVMQRVMALYKMTGYENMVSYLPESLFTVNEAFDVCRCQLQHVQLNLFATWVILDGSQKLVTILNLRTINSLAETTYIIMVQNFRVNKLSLNMNKPNFIMFTNKKHRPIVNITLNGTDIEQVS